MVGFYGPIFIRQQPEGIAELLFAKTAQLAFLGVLGIFFAYLITYISSQNYILKGIIFSVTIWFSAFAITFLFQLPELKEVPLKTVITNFISSISWGIFLGLALNWLDDRLKI